MKNEYIVNAIINNCEIENLRGSKYIVDREHKVIFSKYDNEEFENFDETEVDNLVKYLSFKKDIFTSVTKEIDDTNFEIGEIIKKEIIEEHFLLSKQTFANDNKNVLIIGIITLK